MATPTLSILIPSLGIRSALLRRLRDRLAPQIAEAGPAVELMISVDDGQLSTGAKRGQMVQNAKGDYVCFVDDDDMVAENYVAALLDGLQSGPDCVGFYLRRYVDGAFVGCQIMSISMKAYGEEKWGDNLTLWKRTPNHLCPVRREIALAGGFPPIYRGEDSTYAKRIYRQLKREVFIEDYLYDYLRLSKKDAA